MAKGKLRGEQIKDESIESVDLASGSIKAAELDEECVTGQPLATSLNTKDDRLLFWDSDGSASGSLNKIAPRNLFGETTATDAKLFVSGAIGSKGHENTGGTAVFGGDVAISGSLFVGCDDKGTPTSRALDVYANVSSDYAAVIDNDAGSAGHGLKVTSDGTGSGTNLFDIESASTTLFRVRGDGRAGIGKVTSLPAAILTVSSSNDDGDIAVAHKIQHIGDSDTFIEFDDDAITLYAGNRAFIKVEEAGQDKITVNQDGLDVDLQIKGENKTNLIRTIASTDMVGINTGDPHSTLHISGSQAGNYTDVSTSGAGALTFGASHFIVNYTGNGDAVFTLPDVSKITGRQYHILHNCQGDIDVLTVTGSGGQFLGVHLEGPQNSVNINGSTPQSISIVSTGDNWFILHDGRSQG